MADKAFDIVAIGGGTAGLVTAAGSAGLGARTALVERDRLGGDCLWTGCVPSKALIGTARLAEAFRRADAFGLEPQQPIMLGRQVVPAPDTADAVVAHLDALEGQFLGYPEGAVSGMLEAVGQDGVLNLLAHPVGMG